MPMPCQSSPALERSVAAVLLNGVLHICNVFCMMPVPPSDEMCLCSCMCRNAVLHRESYKGLEPARKAETQQNKQELQPRHAVCMTRQSEGSSASTN